MKPANAIRGYLVFAALVSLWFRAEFPIFALMAPLDDFLFIKLAGKIGMGEWLGPYDHTMLAKGIGYSVFILFNKLTGLPLKISEHLLYLACGWFAATTVARMSGRNWLLPWVFTVVAFSPVPWMIEGGARVVRESLYQTLGVAIVFLAAWYCLKPERNVRLGLALGLIVGWYWLTREEGIWLIPSLSVVVLAWLATGYRRLRNSLYRGSLAPVAWREIHFAILPPLAGFLLPVLVVNSINFAYYGVFRNNELRSGPFSAAYGALARIQHDEWKRYVVFPRDARQRAYAASAAARELRPYLEGSLGQSWKDSSRNYPKPWGCPQEPAACNEEILSGWFLWALRDAVSAAGYYRSAHAADTFYRRLADEINGACDTGYIPCRPLHASLAPVWRTHYLVDSVEASWSVLTTLIAFNKGQVGVSASPISVREADIFRSATNSRISGFGKDGEKSETVDPTHTRVRLSQAIAASYAAASPPLFALALASYLFLLVAHLRVKSANVPAHSIVILTALLVAVLSRVGLLGFLEATSIPSNNMLYLLPAVPFYLLFVATSLGLGGAALFSLMRGRAAAA